MQKTLEEKLNEIEKHKNEIISRVKQTAAKLKFTVKGSASCDLEELQLSLKSARERYVALDEGVKSGKQILYEVGQTVEH